MKPSLPMAARRFNMLVASGFGREERRKKTISNMPSKSVQNTVTLSRLTRENTVAQCPMTP
jgi:hypothetical protein